MLQQKKKACPKAGQTGCLRGGVSHENGRGHPALTEILPRSDRENNQGLLKFLVSFLRGLGPCHCVAAPDGAHLVLSKFIDRTSAAPNSSYRTGGAQAHLTRGEAGLRHPRSSAPVRNAARDRARCLNRETGQADRLQPWPPMQGLLQGRPPCPASVTAPISSIVHPISRIRSVLFLSTSCCRTSEQAMLNGERGQLDIVLHPHFAHHALLLRADSGDISPRLACNLGNRLAGQV